MAVLPARRHPSLRAARAARALTLAAALLLPAGAQATGPPPGSLEYVGQDNQNMADAYGRNTQQQLGNPAYLKHRRSRLTATRFRYLEPVDVGRWEPVELDRSRLLSLYFCSAYRVGARAGEWCP